MIMSALRLSRLWEPKTRKDSPSQSHPGEVAWEYSPGGTGTSGLISPPHYVMESSNKGSHGITLGPATGGSSLGTSSTPGKGLWACITFRAWGQVIRRTGAFPFTGTFFCDVVPGMGGATMGGT